MDNVTILIAVLLTGAILLFIGILTLNHTIWVIGIITTYTTDKVLYREVENQIDY